MGAPDVAALPLKFAIVNEGPLYEMSYCPPEPKMLFCTLMTGEPVLVATRWNLLLAPSVPERPLPLTGAFRSQPMPVMPFMSDSAIEFTQKSKGTSVVALGTWMIAWAIGT